ncbi:DinI-like family protein [Raoultella planticola]|uniref:DinI-like family protein n=1 Tax=Raoultella planticola TaxID=575 RepID=UPI0031BB9F71
MKVEITIDKSRKLPDGAEPALEAEMSRQLNKKFENCTISVRRAGTDGLSIFGGLDDDRETIEEILRETWESADDWFY